MEAIRLYPNSDHSRPYSPANPAPSSALRLDSEIKIPQPLKPGELLVKVEATTVVRDSLTWPESYMEEYKILGNDFSGTIVEINPTSTESVLKVGDEVYGMTDAARAGAWAEYVVVTEEEVWLRPKSLAWAEAASAPLSALTAYQALFDKAGLTLPDLQTWQDSQPQRNTQTSSESHRLLVTGASGSVGLYAVQLARLTGAYVVAASRSNERNRDLLLQLGADEVVEYTQLTKDTKKFDTIIDMIGGSVLESCWSHVQENGTIVSVESASYDFVTAHQDSALTGADKAVKALFFIVSPSAQQLQYFCMAFDRKLLKPFVACVVPLVDIQSAYDQSTSTPIGRGRIVLTPRDSKASLD